MTWNELCNTWYDGCITDEEFIFAAEEQLDMRHEAECMIEDMAN